MGMEENLCTYIVAMSWRVAEVAEELFCVLYTETLPTHLKTPSKVKVKSYCIVCLCIKLKYW